MAAASSSTAARRPTVILDCRRAVTFCGTPLLTTPRMPDSLRDTLQASLGTAYTLSAELGGGGMSRVFVAREEALGRDVVVKVLSSEVAEGLSVERFQREIRLAAALQEPHIVPVLTSGVTALGMPYYTMPFVQGASLRDRLTRGPLPVDEALALLRDVAQALAYAHARGVVHRDIKPENILLSSGTAVVTDFGIAKALQVSRTMDDESQDARGITRTGTSLGTPAYMAPEQAAGDPATDQRADLYAWGVVAYELLTGQHPFAARTSPQQLLRAHLTETPAAFPTTTTVPPRIAALVHQCLAKDPDDRPTSAAAVLQQLHTGQQRTDAPSIRSSASRRIAAVVAFVTLAVVATGMWWRGTTRDAATTTGAPAPVMMAVLPFEHAGPMDQQPFTDGLTDAVTSKLASLSSLLVIDRRSAATYRGTTKPARQIGKELGVRYLLEGVVRWAKDGAGTWRAHVTPTLVDTKAGTIAWTGAPVDVTLDDPFTAQGSIATDVAQAMEVAVLPAERVQLKRRFTDNPQAYAAYQRADQLLQSAELMSDDLNLKINQGAIREVNAAIALDSNFAEAWGVLVYAQINLLLNDVDNASIESVTRRLLGVALRRHPQHPRVLLNAAFIAQVLDHDRVATESLVTKALLYSRNDARTISGASIFLKRWYPDSARGLALRAAQLDPRSSISLLVAAQVSIDGKRWNDASRFAETIVSLNPADERGWTVLVDIARLQGDSIALQNVSNRVRANVSRPSTWLACNMAFGSRELSVWLLGLSAAAQRLTALSDSVWYYDCKTDAARRVRGAASSRMFSDSIIALLSPARRRSIQATPIYAELMLMLAYAQANVGNGKEAASVVQSATSGFVKRAGSDTLPTGFSAHRAATVYALLGDTVSAMRWLKVGLGQRPMVGWYKIDPRLRPLHGTASFQSFVRENDR